MSKINQVNGYDYPSGYEKLIELNLIDFEYWYFIPDTQLQNRCEGMKKRYPNREYIPFARRDDSDDIACFEKGQGEKVYIVHDFADEGYEERKSYENVWYWVRDAIEELIEEQE